MSSARTVPAAIAGVIAAVLLPLALLSSWVAGVVTDSDRYVATVAPLATDPAVVDAVISRLDNETEALVDSAVASLGATELLERFGFSTLTEAARAQLDGVVLQVVTALVRSPEFATAWEAANRSAHEQLVAVLEGNEDAVLDNSGRVSIELGTVVNTITAELRDKGLVPDGVLPELDASFALVESEKLSSAQEIYWVLDLLGFWLPVLWLLALTTALLLTGRRVLIVRRLATAAVGAMALLLLALAAARRQVVGALPDESVSGAVWDVLVQRLEVTIWVVGAVAALVAVGAHWLCGRSTKEEPA